MGKKIFTEEEARERKNARQREYAKRTNYAVNQRYSEKTYTRYIIQPRKKEDAEIIALIESEKAKGFGTTEAIKNLIKKNIGGY